MKQSQRAPQLTGYALFLKKEFEETAETEEEAGSIVEQPAVR